MHLITSLAQCRSEAFRSRLERSAKVGVTIGNFDGMHRGHQALFGELGKALPEGALKVILTFAPHPRRVLNRKRGNVVDPGFWHITTLRRKVELADNFGFDVFAVVRFTRSFARLSPRQFVESYLIDGLQADLVVVGYDWSFGKGRAGSVETLGEIGDELGFETRIVPPFLLDGERVSSSLVREALEQGDLPRLEKLLGRRFEISGLVREGSRRGRTLGFPTANIRPIEQLLPPNGVYAAVAQSGGRRYAAAVSLGVRPVFEEQGERLLEVYFIDAGELDLYGKRVNVEFVRHLRSEQKFESVEALVAAMQKDAAAARQLIAPLL